MRLTSARNPQVKFVRSLERAAVRREEGVYLVEGIRLVAEAIRTGQCARLVLYDPDLLSKSAAGSTLLAQIPEWSAEHFEVSEHVLSAASQTETPAGVVAVLSHPGGRPGERLAEDRFGIVLDRLADPGNAGTILRTACAVGIEYVAALPGTVDLFAPKVVRAGMGAHFLITVLPSITWHDLRQLVPATPFVAIDAHGERLLYDFDWPGTWGLVVGSEAHGFSPETQSQIRHRIRIPMRPEVESLNAAVAASIVAYSALGPAISSRV